MGACGLSLTRRAADTWGYLALSYTAEGVPVTTFSVASNRKWTASDGTPGKETIWFRVTALRRLAETCNQYLTKGRQVTPALRACAVWSWAG